MSLRDFADLINASKEEGVIIEFGTGTGRSSQELSEYIPNRRILTFDGFIGLPSTEKGIPQGTDWTVGNYHYEENDIKNKLSYFKNVEVYKRMSWEIVDPVEFNVDKVVGINIDFDLYEGTIDALRFIDKTSWNNLYIRFDDWGAYPHQIDSEVDAHEKAAFYDWIKETQYSYKEFKKTLYSSSGLQTIMLVTKNG